MINEILKKRIEEAANDRYTDNTFAYKGFIYGAEYALSHQWISIEDALPECSVMVIVKDKYGNYDIAYLSKKGYWIANDGKEIVVSFWMPIPKFETKKK